LEILHKADISLSGESDSTVKEACTVIGNGFTDLKSPLMAALVAQQSLASEAAQQRHTRIRALLKKIL